VVVFHFNYLTFCNYYSTKEGFCQPLFSTFFMDR
jgi:hypothetical protein